MLVDIINLDLPALPSFAVGTFPSAAGNEFFPQNNQSLNPRQMSYFGNNLESYKYPEKSRSVFSALKNRSSVDSISICISYINLELQDPSESVFWAGFLVSKYLLKRYFGALRVT